MKQISNGEKEIEKEIESEIEKETYITTSDEVVCRTKDVRQIVEEWNKLGLQQITKITADSTRGKMLKARIREHGIDAIYTAIENINKSDFLKGKNDKGWVISFEWFVKPNNFVKVLEGNYEERSSSQPEKKKRQYTTAEEYTAPKSNKSTDDLWKLVDKI